jgi:fatty acid desaturase
VNSTESTLDRVATAPRQVGSDFAPLLAQVRGAGLLDRRPTYYAIRCGVVAATLVAGWTAFVLIGDSWWQLATAVWLAVAFAQTAFIGHDAGHRQIFRTRRPNEIIGLLVGDLMIGLSYGWWVDNHNRHHAHPNQEGRDPDIEIPTVAFTEAQVTGRGRLAAFGYRYQAYFFFPLLTLQAVGFHVESVRAMFADFPHRRWERVLLAVHAAAYFGAVFTVLSPVKAVVFVVVHQALLGFYLGCSFAPNHKGMPVLDADDDSDFLRRQVITARNIHGGWFVDIALGGLNYQIEHHLFPSAPCAALRRIQPLVRAHCAAHGLGYAETGLFDSYRRTLRYLRLIGRGGHPAATVP